MKRNLTKLLLLFVVMVVGVLSANAQTDVTASYIGDVNRIINSGGHSCTNNHKFSDGGWMTGEGYFNSQTLPEAWHNFVPNTQNVVNGVESWSGDPGGEGFMLGRLTVLPQGKYTLKFTAMANNIANTVVKCGNQEQSFNAVEAYEEHTFTIDVTTDNTPYEFGVYQKDGGSANWAVMGNISLTLTSTNIIPVANNSTDGFTYDGTQTWHTNDWSTEGNADGTKFITPFHELWTNKANNGKLADATITGSYTPTQSGVYKVSAWVRAVNENGGAINGVKIFVGDVETAAYTGASVINGTGRLGTYTAMADGVSGTPINYGFKIKDADINWLAFKNVTITYLGSLPEEEVTNLLDRVPEGKMNATTQSTLSGLVSAFNANKSVVNYNALSQYISTAQASINLYEQIAANIANAKTLYEGIDASDFEDKYNNGLYANDYDPGQIYTEFAQAFVTNNATPEAGTDFTLAIVNPSFELATAAGQTDMFGWTQEYTDPRSNGYTFQTQNSSDFAKDGTYFIESWQNSSSNLSNRSIAQSIANLPNGIYKLEARTNGIEGAYLKGNTDQVDATNGSSSVKVLVSDGNLTISVGLDGAGSNWVCIDDFRLTFVGTKDNYIAALKAQLTEEDAQTAFETAANAATTVDAIDAAFQTAIRTQKTEGADYTAAIVNPSFETGDLTGWTLNSSSYDKGVVKSEGNKATTNVDGTYYFNIWDWEGKGGDPITQTIDLPNGTYKLTAVAASDDGNTVLLTANGGNAEIPCTGDANGIEGELTFAVTNGKAIIGAEGKDKCWYKVDDFRLEYVGGIEEVDNITDLAATTGEAIFSMTGWEVIVAGEDSIIAQNMTSETPAGIMLKGTKSVSGANTAAIDKVISGQVYGTYDADTHVFTVKTNSGNKFEAVNGTTALTKRDIAVATQPGNVYLYTVIEDATIVDKEGNFYATVGDDEILIDKHFNADLVLNNGDVVNSITGITILNEDGTNCALAPLSQDDIVPVLWSAENIEEGEVKDDSNPIDLTKGKELNRMKNLAAGDVLKVKVVEDNHMDSRGQRRAIALRGTVAVTTRSDLGVFYIPFNVDEESAIVEVPITADIQKEVNDKGLKIAVKGANASMVTVSNAVYTAEETENSIWLSKDANEVTLGEYHFGDVRKNDVLTAEGDGAKMAIIVENGDDIDVTSGEPLSKEQAAALQDNELSVKDATKVVFTLGDDPRNDKFEVPENEDGTYDSFAQGAQVTGVDGMIMTFGGNDPEGAAYEFEEAYPEVNKFGSVTEGINTFPVDDEDKPYDPEVKNLPTKGTYYVFEPTKDGKLDVTVGLEKGKKLFVTEDGEALKDFNGITKVNNNLISFPVEATKTYYVFANETNLEYYGFTFVPTTDCENIAKDIATFKLIPQDNADGDTLLLKDAVVTYINGDDIFVEDASGATTFFRTNIQFYVGQKLNGYIIGQNHEREFLPQLLKVEGKTTYKTFEVTENVTPEAKVISVADASKEENIGRFVKLENLEVSKDDHGFTVLFDPETENSIRIEDHFNVFYTLNRIVRGAEGIVGVNKEGTIIFWPTSKEGVDSPNPLFTEGYYVFRNVASGLYLGAGNSWGTQATLLDYSESQKLIGIDDYTYKMESQVSNGGSSYFFNGSYMDGNSAAELTFAKKDDYYTISVGGKFLGNGTTAAYTTGQYVLGLDVDGESEDALWEVIPATKAALAKATEEAPVDATFLIKNPNFGRNNRNSSAWTMEAGNKNLCGGKDNNKCAESWHSVFTLSQKLENMPKGVYELTAQGFYGQDGSDNEHLPVFYANDDSQAFCLKTGVENSMDLASFSFAQGKYASEPVVFELTADGDITLGAKLADNTTLWCIWDNFHLKYYGANATLASVKEAATAAHQEKTQQLGKNFLDKMKQVVEATNVYTQTAYDKYYGTWIAKYEAGTLTKDDINTLQDPTAITDWHVQITVDDFLLSAWDTNPDFQDAPYYINSWSNEGTKDGTNFGVPFFEYFGNPLDGKTLTATVNGLEAGAYDVTAWVRVATREKTAESANGVTLQVNDGTPVDVCTGEMVDCEDVERFFLKEVSANGIVGADGVLKIKFNVAADNNIHWLSFKNVKYTGSSTDGISDVVRYKSGAVYNLNGQKVNKDLKPGLYIINGQKRVVK